MFTSLLSRIAIVLGIIGASALTATTMQMSAINYDVVVYGAGTSGFAAAIEAVRLGSKVVLIEPTDWVGGQAVAAGVTSMDNSLYTNPVTNRRELLVPGFGHLW